MKRCLLLAFFACLTVFLPAQAELQPVAIVRLTRSQPITVRELKIEVAKMEAQSGRPLTAEERRQVLDAMINERLALQAAERDRVVVSDAEVNAQLQQIRAAMAQGQQQPTEAEFAAVILEQTGLDMAAYREQIRRGLVVQKYMLSKKKSDIDGIHAPTEEDIIGYYNANRTEFTRPETVRFSMILVKFGDNRTESRSRIDRLAVELGGNAQKFDEAVMKSRAAGSTLGYQGGDAGYLPRNAQSMQVMGTELVNLAFTLRVNEVSRVLETPQGFVIVKVTETYPIKILEMDDVYQLGYGLSVHDYIGRGILQMRQQQTLARIQQELVAELRTGNPFQIIEANLNW